MAGSGEVVQPWYTSRVSRRVLKSTNGDFSGGPVVKTSPSSAVCTGSALGQRAKSPYASQPKHQNINRSNIVTNSMNYFKNGPHPKNL